MAYDPKTVSDMATLLLKLSGNPKTRRKQLELVKEMDPNFRLPADIQVESLKEDLKKEAEEAKIRAQAEKYQRQSKSQRQALLDSGRYNEEQVKEIEEKVMKKYRLGDYEAASKLYAADIAPAKPSNREKMRHGQIWEFPDIPGLLQNPDKAATDAAYSIIDELNAGR